MSEISPIDRSILDLLTSGRTAVEKETSDRAARIHEAAMREGQTISIGGLVLKECIDLRKHFTCREEHYLSANWFQRLRMDKRAAGAFTIRVARGGQEVTVPDSLKRMARNQMLKNGRNFTSGSLFPQEAEHIDSQSLVQDWFITSEPYYKFKTYYRVTDTNSRQSSVTQLHSIYPLDEGVRISAQDQDGIRSRDLEEMEFFFPLGLIDEANRQIKESVPTRVSKKW